MQGAIVLPVANGVRPNVAMAFWRMEKTVRMPRIAHQTNFVITVGAKIPDRSPTAAMALWISVMKSANMITSAAPMKFVWIASVSFPPLSSAIASVMRYVEMV